VRVVSAAKVDFGTPTEPDVNGETEPAADDGLTLECTDIRNAERLLELHAVDLRHVGTWGKWLVWDGARWALDETGGTLERAKATARTMADETAEQVSEAKAEVERIDPEWLSLNKRERKSRASTFDDAKKSSVARAEADLAVATLRSKWAKQSQMAARLDAMIDVAKSDPKVAITHTMLDADPLLFNVSNGTINLQAGQIRPHRREDLITKLAPIAYDETGPRERFEKFMREVCCGDDALVAFHKRFLGYALTGETREHIFAFWYGTGGNGKSVLANIVMQIMGDYACKAMPDLVFRIVGSEKHETELCDLHGRRLVFCNETKQGRTLDDGRIKDLTGGDPIRARRMREDSWQWDPTHKLVLFGQYKPTLRTVDDGMRRRTKLVPFAAKFTGEAKDDRLQDKLAAEASGVLAWLVEGARDWYQHRIPAAKAVDAATDAYFREEDTIGTFFEGECVFHADARVTRKELRSRYVAWSEERDEKPLPTKAFSQAVRDRGATDGSVRDAGNKPRDGWRGVRLLTPDEAGTRKDAPDVQARREPEQTGMHYERDDTGGESP
jgi:putative DNA primase/helicase